MTYNELYEAILTAQNEMLKCKIEANSVTLNGRRYGKLIDNCPPNMKPTIVGMAVKTDYSMPDDYDFLVQYEPPQPQTNGDRIRAMTDEELAEFIRDHIDCSICKIEVFETITCPGSLMADGKDCYDRWLDWLKQEVE